MWNKKKKEWPKSIIYPFYKLHYYHFLYSIIVIIIIIAFHEMRFSYQFKYFCFVFLKIKN